MKKVRTKSSSKRRKHSDAKSEQSKGSIGIHSSSSDGDAQSISSVGWGGQASSPPGHARSRSTSMGGLHRSTSFRPAQPSMVRSGSFGGDNPFEDESSQHSESDDGHGETWVRLKASSGKKDWTLRNAYLNLHNDHVNLSQQVDELRGQYKKILSEITRTHNHNKRTADTLAQISQGKQFEYEVGNGSFIELDDSTKIPMEYDPDFSTSSWCGCFGC